MTNGPMMTKAADKDILLKQVRAYAAQTDLEPLHSHHVTNLAEQLFDALTDVHQCDPEDKFLLVCAGLLHDIGWQGGQQKHHKRSMEMILEQTDWAWTTRERIITALIARYHRKALPKKSHRVFNMLDAAGRQKVCKLAALLRIADGLDRRHRQTVRSVETRIEPKTIVVACCCAEPANPELDFARQKADLFEKVFGRSVEFSAMDKNSRAVMSQGQLSL